MGDPMGDWPAPSEDIAPYWDFSAYHARAQAVYWNPSTPACRARGGPHKAMCLLPPGHGGGLHYGNGFDEFGPKGAAWWADR